MDSKTIMLIVLVLNALSAVAFFWLGFQSKNEEDEAFSIVHKKLENASQTAIEKINSRTDQVVNKLDAATDSIILRIEDKYFETSQSIDKFNLDLENASKNLSTQIKSISNPLAPFLIDTRIEVDFSSVTPDEKAILDYYKEYLEGLGSYADIRELSRKEQLPWGLILHYKDSTEKDITVICNPDLTYTHRGNFDRRQIAFSIKENNFLTVFFPPMYLSFSAETKHNQDPTLTSDLLYEINGYETERPIKLDYRIDFEKKIIIFSFKVDNPYVSFSNGKVTSVFNCVNGNMGVGFEETNGTQIIIKNIFLKLGENYKNVKPVRLKRKSDGKLEYLFYDPLRRKKFYYMEGKDLCN